MSALKLIYTDAQPQKRNYINTAALHEPKTDVLFTEFISQTVERKAKRMASGYRNNYNSVIAQLNRFSELNDVKIFTNSVNEEFLDDFILFLEDQNKKRGYIKLLISLTKAMIKKAGSYGYAVDPSYDDVNVDDDDPFAVYLSMNEITRIYYFKGLTRKQEAIRDLFVVGCLTALRYSDYSTLTQDNFQGDYIVKITQKTKKKVTIPLHDYVREIYQKYDGEISKGLSIQYFNRALKTIMMKIGLDEPVKFSFTRGGELIHETKPKYDMITSHTARRSAATNMYLTGRLKTYEIMSITGHTTEKSFFRYIKVSQEDTAKQIAGDTFFRK